MSQKEAMVEKHQFKEQNILVKVSDHYENQLQFKKKKFSLLHT